MAVQKVEADAAALKNVVCAVSHAAIPEEVGYANISGVVVVLEVSKQTDELILLIPTGEPFLPRPYFLVGEPLFTYEPSEIVEANCL